MLYSIWVATKLINFKGNPYFMSIELYEKAAKRFKPDKIKILFIAESPPFKKEGEEPRYFYFENVKGNDFLFRSIMEVLFPEEYEHFKRMVKFYY
jgi:hypothetical protein